MKLLLYWPVCGLLFLFVERFSRMMKFIILTYTAALICVSTAFVKQHSVLDFLAALPLCAIAYPICFKARAGARQEKKWTKKPDKTCC